MPRTALSALVLSLLGCLSPPPDGNGAEAQVRLLNAAPGRSALRLFGDDEKRLGPALAYGESSSFVSVPPHPMRLTVRAEDEAREQTELTVPFSPSGVITLVALATPDGALALFVVDHAFAPPHAGLIRVRVVHAARTLPAVDVDVGGDGVKDALALPLGGASQVAGFELPADARAPIDLYDASTGAPVARFTVPALPAQSEVLWEIGRAHV